VLHCVAVCCSVAECCSVLYGVAECCSVSAIAVFAGSCVLQGAAECCSVLQCVAERYRVLQGDCRMFHVKHAQIMELIFFFWNAENSTEMLQALYQLHYLSIHINVCT